MNKFVIIFSKPSKDDIDDLANYIIGKCKAPKTAADYTKGILKKINSIVPSAMIKHISSISIKRKRPLSIMAFYNPIISFSNCQIM